MAAQGYLWRGNGIGLGAGVNIRLSLFLNHDEILSTQLNSVIRRRAEHVDVSTYPRWVRADRCSKSASLVCIASLGWSESYTADIQGLRKI
jgi:hypothetical protein